MKAKLSGKASTQKPGEIKGEKAYEKKMPIQSKKGLFGLFSPKVEDEEGGGEEWQLIPIPLSFCLLYPWKAAHRT